jgi:hypothetical protein
MASQTLHCSGSPLAGTWRIVRFNWPRYALALAIVATSASATALPLPRAARMTLWAGASLAIFWSIMSVIGAYLVYDRSDLYQWRWLREVLEEMPTRWINIHAGVDSIGRRMLHELFPAATGAIVDIYDPTVMTEASIARVQGQWQPDPRTVYGRYDHLPMASAEADLALLLLSAHELRTSEAREALFGELRRIIRPNGTVVLVEHLRDLANFIAFGPGAFHFFSRRTWMEAIRAGSFAVADEVRFTRLVHAFLLRREP